MFSEQKNNFRNKIIDLHVFLQAGGSSALLMDLAANEKSVHADFFNGK